MLQIDMTKLIGKPFKIIGKPFKTGNDQRLVCFGYGQDPSSGANYVVGAHWDQSTNTTILQTDLLKNVEFEGNIVDPTFQFRQTPPNPTGSDL